MGNRASYAPHTARMVEGASVVETAKVLGIHPETVRRLIREKRIKAERGLNKLGHGYAIPQSEIERIKTNGIDYTKVVR